MFKEIRSKDIFEESYKNELYAFAFTFFIVLLAGAVHTYRQYIYYTLFQSTPALAEFINAYSVDILVYCLGLFILTMANIYFDTTLGLLDNISIFLLIVLTFPLRLLVSLMNVIKTLMGRK